MSINKSAASRSSGRNQASDQIPTNKQEDYSHYFDDDFEVIYDGDLPDLPSEEDDDDDYYDVLSNLSELDHTKKIDYVKENVDKPRQKERRCEKAQEKKKRRMPNLLSPAARTAKTGARAALQVANMLLRCATLILILLIMWLLARNFWDNHSALGNIARMVSEKNYVLGGYTGVALFLLLFELITFLMVLFGKNIQPVVHHETAAHCIHIKVCQSIFQIRPDILRSPKAFKPSSQRAVFAKRIPESIITRLYAMH